MQQRLVYIETARWIFFKQLAYKVDTNWRHFLSESFVTKVRIFTFDLLEGLLAVG